MRSALNNVPKYALKSLKHESILSCGISIQRCVSDVSRCTGVGCGVKCHMPGSTNPKKISWRHTVVSTWLLQSSLRLNCHKNAKLDYRFWTMCMKKRSKVSSERKQIFCCYSRKREQRNMIIVLCARWTRHIRGVMFKTIKWPPARTATNSCQHEQSEGRVDGEETWDLRYWEEKF